MQKMLILLQPIMCNILLQFNLACLFIFMLHIAVILLLNTKDFDILLQFGIKQKLQKSNNIKIIKMNFFLETTFFNCLKRGMKCLP